MVRRGSLDREAYWRGVIENWGASGLSIAAFCRDRGVSPPSFYQWKRKLEAIAPMPPNGKFVSIDLSSGQPRNPFELILDNGRRIVVPAPFCETSLRHLIRVLQEEPSC